MQLVRPETVPTIAVCAFFLALIGVAFGFASSNRTNAVAAQLMQFEAAGLTVMQGRIDHQATKIVALQAELSKLNACACLEPAETEASE